MLECNENDYKYVLQDISNVYLGARFTYGEILENDYVPGRFQDVVGRIFSKEAGDDCSVYEHLCSMKEDSDSYKGYKQLRIRIKVAVPTVKVDKKGKETVLFPARDYTFEEFMQDEALKHNEEVLIQEICFKKRHLASMHI
ncbi:MAG: hypothetical protein K6G07_01330 [Lachnospiraceae bacterium]|nr:hypothetical protein [Lachnospiraceae bacterium]